MQVRGVRGVSPAPRKPSGTHWRLGPSHALIMGCSAERVVAYGDRVGRFRAALGIRLVVARLPVPGPVPGEEVGAPP